MMFLSWSQVKRYTMKTKTFKGFLSIISAIFFLFPAVHGQGNRMIACDSTAILLIDIQMFYFPGSPGALVNPEEASLKAKQILEKSREQGVTVIHVRHESQTGGDIHPNVLPIEGEKVITKREVNSFAGTDLLEFLQQTGISHLIICGMMTHMCVEAATRAAHDLGFRCTVVSDACTTRDLRFGDHIINARDVHLSTLATLQKTYATVLSVRELLEKMH